MKKIFAILLSLLMVLCFVGCEKSTDQVPQNTKEPESILDPNRIDFRYNEKENTADRWYLQGTDDVIYIYFTSDNDAGLCTYHLVKSGVVQESIPCVVSQDMHLVAESHDKSGLDLVFEDAFTAYDYASDCWYSRGDKNEIESQLVNKTFTDENDNKNTLCFYQDYSCKKRVGDDMITGNYVFTAPQSMECDFAEDSMNFEITYNDDFTVKCIKSENTVFYPEIQEGETVNKYKAY